MEKDDAVMLIGQGVDSPWYVGNTATGLLERFGADRVVDTPVSENAVTGAAVGAAIVGMRPVVVHPRIDFMMYAMDPVVNEASNWHYMFGGASRVPVVIWGIINRGGEQAAQHSQALQAFFAHIPGLKVVAPATPYDAKGLMVAAIHDDNPVVFIDDRWLYGLLAPVPEKMYEVPIGKAAVRRTGRDVTIVSSSFMMCPVLEAAEQLAGLGVSAEVIDLRTIKPLDRKTILKSIVKTRRLVVVDGGWKSFGVSAELLAMAAEEAFHFLMSPPMRVALPDVPAPASLPLENAFYPGAQDVVAAVKKTIGIKSESNVETVVKITLSNPDISSAEIHEVIEVLNTPALSFGPKVAEFEKLGAEIAGRKYAVAVNSGTSGLHLLVRAMGITEGDKVITTPFSFIASANCMLFEKAIPVFADIDPLTLNIDPEKIEDLLKRDTRREIKAILAVDIFSHPADWDALYDLSERYGVELIEDSCEAIGSLYRSPETVKKKRWKTFQRTGSFGRASVYAFYPNKQITTGEGGLVLTDDKNIYEQCVSMRNQGRGQKTNGIPRHVRLGYNYRLSDVSCALGVAQLKRLDEIMKKRAAVASWYTDGLASFRNVTPPYAAPNVCIDWFVYVVRMKGGFSRRERDVVMKNLAAKGIDCSGYFYPIHLQPFYRKMFGFTRGDFPVTESISDCTIALPFFNSLSRKNVEYVLNCLREQVE